MVPRWYRVARGSPRLGWAWDPDLPNVIGQRVSYSLPEDYLWYCSGYNCSLILQATVVGMPPLGIPLGSPLNSPLILSTAPQARL